MAQVTKSLKLAKSLSKKKQVLSLLKRGQGASIAEIQTITDWQPHTIRAFFSRTVRKQLALTITTNLTKAKVQRHRILKQDA